MKKARVNVLMCAAQLVAAIGWTVAVPAAEPEDTNAETEGLQEVVVTATKRETGLQETPLAISAVSGETLEKLGAASVEDYIHQVPGFDAVDAGPSRKQYSVRGLGTSVVGQALVGQYLDETPITGNGIALQRKGDQPDPVLVDMERVEILRGPQGTLFGAGAMGGAVRNITHKPDLTRFGARVETEMSSTHFGGESYNANAMLNLPLIEGKLGLRLVGFWRQQAGFIDNVFNGLSCPAPVPPRPNRGVANPPQCTFNPQAPVSSEISYVPFTVPANNAKDVNDYRVKGGRAMARWEPGGGWQIDLGMQTQQADSGGNPVFSIPLTASSTDGPVQSLISPENYQDDWTLSMLTVSYKTALGSFVSATSYFDRDDSDDGISRPYPALQGAFGPLALQSGQRNSQSWTEELRFASDFSGPLQTVIGLFYYDSDRFSNENVRTPNPGTGQYVYNYDFDQLENAKNKAVFGELSYAFWQQKLKLTAGARYFEQSRDLTNTYRVRQPFNNPSGPVGAGLDPLSSSETGTTLKFNLSYQAAKDTLLYAQAAQGFREGGYNYNAVILPGQIPPSFDSDSVWSYELGWKSSWLHRRLVVNGAVYQLDWSNIQTSDTVLSGLAGFGFIYNSGRAQFQGVELETSFAPSSLRGLSLNLGSSYLFKHELTTAARAAGNLGLNALPGDEVPFVPAYTFNAAVNYEHPLVGAWSGFGQWNWSYTSDRATEYRPVNSVTGVPNVRYFQLPSYRVMNLRFGVRSESWTVTAFVNNLTDARPALTINYETPVAGPSDDIRQTTIRPRTYGINLSKSF